MGLLLNHQNLEYGLPVRLSVQEYVSSDPNMIRVNCKVESGIAKPGFQLVYKPQYAGQIPVTIKKITGRMMEIQKVDEGDVAEFTFEGDFSFTPAPGDLIVNVGDS